MQIGATDTYGADSNQCFAGGQRWHWLVMQSNIAWTMQAGNLH
jgi:hypothetical protein